MITAQAPVSPILQATGHLQGLISQVFEKANEVQSRLSPLLVPGHPPPSESGEAKEAPATSSLVNKINDMSNEMEIVSDLLADVLIRLEI